MHLSDLRSNLLIIDYSETQIGKILSDVTINKNTTLEACSGINNSEPVFVQSYSELLDEKDKEYGMQEEMDQEKIKDYILKSGIKSPIFSNPNYVFQSIIAERCNIISYWWNASSIESDLTVNNLVSDCFCPTISDKYGDSIENSIKILQIIKRIVDRQFKFAL